MYNKCKKAISLLLVLAMFISMIPLDAYANSVGQTAPYDSEQNQRIAPEGFVSDDNGYIKYYVNRQTGGFHILPSTQSFDETKTASFGSFRINGEEFIFGGDYPNSEFVLSPVINHGGTCQTTWRMSEYYITQFLNIVQNDEGINSYAVYIRYEVESAYEGIELDIDFEGRILLDTILGLNDELPVSFTGDFDFITNETTVTDEDIPMFFEVSSKANTPARAYGLLINESVTSPHTLTFARFSDAVNSVFEYNHDEIRNFRGDSSVLLYFYGQNDGDTIYYSTIYGFDNLIHATDAEKNENPEMLNNFTSLLSDNGVNISIENAIGTNGVIKGRYYYLHAEIENEEDNSVVWKLGGNTTEATTLSWNEWWSNYAYLYISLDEEADSLFVTATSASNPTKSATVELDFIASYTATVTSIGDGYFFYTFDVFWEDIYSLENIQEANTLNADFEKEPEYAPQYAYAPGEKAMVIFSIDHKTLEFDEHWWRPVRTKAIERIIIKDSIGNEIEYKPFFYGESDLISFVFEMPASDVIVELISVDAKRIELADILLYQEKFNPIFAEKHNNPFNPFEGQWGYSYLLPAFAAGSDITLYVEVCCCDSENPMGFTITGKDTLNEYALSFEGFQRPYESEDGSGWGYFIYSFILPDEDVLLDYIYYTATVSAVGEGFDFLGFWIKYAKDGGDSHYFSSSGEFFTGDLVQADFIQDIETFDAFENDEDGNPILVPTKAIKNFIFRNADTNEIIDVYYEVSSSIPLPKADSSWEWEDTVAPFSMNFVMPGNDTSVELVSSDARRIETANQLSDEFHIVYAEKHNNPYHPHYNPWNYLTNAVYASGNEITVYMTSNYGGVIPGDLNIVGKRSSKAYTLVERESFIDWWTGSTIYAYSFIMPDEDVILTGTYRHDENHKFNIIPDIQANRGALEFSGEGIVIEGSAASILPGQKVTIDIAGIDHVHHDFHGVSISGERSSIAVILTEEVYGQRYSFVMPATNVYVHLDVRQKPTYSIDSEIDRTVSGITFRNARSGASNSGYAGDKITFDITNRNIKKVFDSVRLLNVTTRAVVHEFAVGDVYADSFSSEFVMPAYGVIVQVIFADAPPVPIIIDNSIPAGTIITPATSQVLLGDSVAFGFSSNDGRYLIYRPVLRAFDSNGNLVYEEHYQHEKGLTGVQTISFVSGFVRKTGGVPASILIGVYELPFSYTKELVSIKPNSTQAELFNEIIVTGRNLYEGDSGIVNIRSSIHSSQPAIITSHSFDTIRIHVPEDMRPVNSNVTYYVEINGVEESCTIIFDRRLRSEPFGRLAVVSNSANRHSIIIADSEEELLRLAGTSNIIMRMLGNVRYDLVSNTYEFFDGSVLMNGFATYSIAENNILSVRETHGDEMQSVYGVEIFGAKGNLSVPGKTFVKNNSIGINLQHGTKYIDTWAKDRSGNLFRMGEENIVIEYSKLDAGLAVLSHGIALKISDAVLLKNSITEGGQGYFRIGALGAALNDEKFMEASLVVDVQRVVWAPNSVGGNFVLQGIESEGVGKLPRDLIPGIGFKTEVEVYVNTFEGIYRFDAEIEFKALKETKFGASVGLMTSDNGSLQIDSIRGIFGGKWMRVPVYPPFAYLTGAGFGVSGLARNSNPNALSSWRIDLYGIMELITLFELDPIRMSIGPGEISFDAKAFIKIATARFDIINRFDGGIYSNSNGIRFNVSLDAVIVKGFDVINGGGHANLEFMNGRFSFSGSLFVRIQVPQIHVVSMYVPPWFVITKWHWLPWKIQGYWAGNYWQPVYIGPFTLLQMQANMSDTSVSAFFKVVGYGLRADYVYGGWPSVRPASIGEPNSLETIEYIFDDDGTYLGYVTYGSNLSIAAVPRLRGSSPIMAMNASNYENWIAIEKAKIIVGVNPDDDDCEETMEIEFEDWSTHFITLPDDISSHVDDYALLITAPTDDIRITDSNGNPFVLRYAADLSNGGVIEDELNRAGVNAVVISNGSNGNDPVESETFTIMIRLPKEPGEWVVKSSMPFASVIMRVAPLPEIKGVTFNGTDKISWSANGLDVENDVYMLEVRMSTNNGKDIANVDPGILIDEIMINSNVVDGFASGNYTIDLNKIKEFDSGEYFPRLVLLAIPKHEYIAAGNKITDDVTLMPRHAMTANVPIVHVNINEPAPIVSVTASAGGSGALKVEWSAVDNKASGYYLRVLGVSGNPIFTDHDAFDENGEIVGTNSSQVIYDIPNDMGEYGSFSALLGGLIPGAVYQIEVSPYTDVPVIIDGETQYNTIRGKSTLSNTTLLPVPNMPVINTALPSSGVQTDGLGNRIIFVNSNFSFNLSSNQQCRFEVLQDGAVIYESDDYIDSKNISISMDGRTMSLIQVTAVNRGGDMSFSNFTVYFDDIAPPLFLETDEENTVHADEDGQYIIKGYSTAGTSIYDDLGNRTIVDENGEFVLNGSLSQGADSSLRSVTAMSSTGNSTTSDIIIVVKKTIIRGDVNGDGVIDYFDVSRLLRYLWEVDTSIVDFVPENADVNSDGVVDYFDVSLLLRYLWDIEPGPFGQNAGNIGYQTATNVDSTESTVKVSSETSKAGEEVTLTVSLENNPGIAHYSLTMEYPDELTFVSATAGDIFDSYFKYKQESGEVTISAISPNGADVTGDTTLYTVTFKVNEGVRSGFIDGIKLGLFKSRDAIEHDARRLAVDFVQGGITVTDTKTVVSDADFLREKAAGILRNGLAQNNLRLNGKVLTLIIDGREFTLSTNANNRNVDGEIALGNGHFLRFDIKGNGSNVKVFEVVKR